MVKILKNSANGIMTCSEIHEQMKLNYNSHIRKAAVNNSLVENNYFLALDKTNWTVDPEYDFELDTDLKDSE